MFPDQFQDPFEVIGDKDEPHVGRCPGPGLFGHYMIEPPLSFYGPERMFDDGLPSFIKLLVPGHPLGIVVYALFELALLYDLSVLFCGGIRNRPIGMLF